MDHLARAAQTAADPDAPPRARIAALAAVVEAVSLHGLAIPDAIADAVDDPALIEAAIGQRQTSAICAALHQLGPRAELATTRRRVVRRLVAAGATGTNLADLAFQIGDLAAGVTLAVRDHDDHVVPRLASPPPDPIAEAWLTWLADQPDPAVAAVLRAIAARGPLDPLLRHAGAHAGRLRTRVG
jgi:hypothetical protein